MNRTLAIIHTTPVTVEPLKALAKKILPDFEVVNFVDDTILPQLARNGGNVAEVQERIIQYAKYAEETGADVILSACSSVGEVVALAKKSLSIPIIRIDESMAEKAITLGNRVGIAATVTTTLNPTLKLLKDKAEKLSKQVEFQPVLAEEAYKRLINGDRDGHDEVLAAVLSKLAEQTDIVVLAQASMARVLEKLPKDQQRKFLTSPELGMERVKQTMEGIYK